MLPRDDVFDMVAQFAVLLAEQAVFATVIRTAADQLAQRTVRHLSGVGMNLPPHLQFKNCDQVRRVNRRFILRAFVLAQ